MMVEKKIKLELTRTEVRDFAQLCNEEKARWEIEASYHNGEASKLASKIANRYKQLGDRMRNVL